MTSLETKTFKAFKARDGSVVLIPKGNRNMELTREHSLDLAEFLLQAINTKGNNT